MTSAVRAAKLKGSKMKLTNKPSKRKIVVALLGMCLAVSSYTIPNAQASASQEQVAAAAPPATTVQSAPTQAQSPVFYGYNYNYYYYYFYYYYQPSDVFFY